MDTLKIRIRDILLEEFGDDLSIEDIDVVMIKNDYNRIAQRILDEIKRESS